LLKNGLQVDKVLRLRLVLSEGTQCPTILKKQLMKTALYPNPPTHCFIADRRNLTDPQQTNTLSVLSLYRNIMSRIILTFWHRNLALQF
jgi:hypothetical protein